MGDGQSRDNGPIFEVLMASSPFFGHFGLNIGSATLLMVLLGLHGLWPLTPGACRHSGATMRDHIILGYSPACSLLQLHSPKGERAPNLIHNATTPFLALFKTRAGNNPNLQIISSISNYMLTSSVPRSQEPGNSPDPERLVLLNYPCYSTTSLTGHISHHYIFGRHACTGHTGPYPS